MEQRYLFRQMILEQLGIHVQKKKKKKNLDPDITLFIKDYRSKFKMQNYKTLKK